MIDLNGAIEKDWGYSSFYGIT